MRLSVLIVNYRSGAFARALVQALLEQWRRAGAAREALEFVVVDNASPTDESRALSELAALGARVEHSRENLGYAAGMNLALARSSGAADDALLVVNPDVLPFPGALERLLETLVGTPRAGAVGPRAYLEPTRTWLAPPNRLPTPEDELASRRAAHDAAFAARLSRERTRRALAQWTASAPLEVEMLSGACFVARRGTLAAAGGLFDARYPLYYEDTDLARRLERAGLASVLEPRAEIVHHWARSSGIEEHDSEPERRHAVSRARYFERWFGARADALATPGPSVDAPRLADADSAPIAGDPTLRSDNAALRSHDAALRSDDESLRSEHTTRLDFEPLGACAEAPELCLPGAGRVLVELAMTPAFPLAAATFAEGGRWRMDARAFEWFYRGRYFVQVLDPGGERVARRFTFDKHSAARVAPLEPSELGSSELGSPAPGSSALGTSGPGSSALAPRSPSDPRGEARR